MRIKSLDSRSTNKQKIKQTKKQSQAGHIKINPERRSQDGGVGRRGVSVSPQLGSLPAAGGGF